MLLPISVSIANWRLGSIFLKVDYSPTAVPYKTMVMKEKSAA
jgi:hypothetical protein